MISTDDLTLILAWMQKANICDLSLQEGSQRLRLQLEPAPVSAVVPSPKQHQVKSAGLGRFLSAHPRRPQTKVVSGDHVASGQVVAYLKAGHTLTAITADIDGTVAEISANDDELLGYSVPVLTIEE